MWDWNMSPFGISRSLGYYGANKLFTGYVEKRLQLPTEEEKVAVKDVLLQTNMRSKSSEASITMILQFGAWARHPA